MIAEIQFYRIYRPRWANALLIQERFIDEYDTEKMEYTGNDYHHCTNKPSFIQQIKSTPYHPYRIETFWYIKDMLCNYAIEELIRNKEISQDSSEWTEEDVMLIVFKAMG